MEAKKGIHGARKREGVWCRTSAAVMMIMAVSIILLVGGTGVVKGDSTVQNLSKATVRVDAQVLAAGETLTIAISSGDTAIIDLSHTKNISGLKIKDAKEYFVVENQAGTSAVLDGLSVVTLDLVEAKVVEAAF